MTSAPNPSPLAIIAIGHSVRALLAAIRDIPNLRCLAVDYYGDADTRELATEGWLPLEVDPTSRLTPQTLDSIASLASKIRNEGSEVVVLLAGGMENHADAIDQLSSVGRLLSPSSRIMRQLRDRHVWRGAAHASGLNFPEIREHDCNEIDTHSKQWLWKPTKGAGGWRVKRACDAALTSTADGYWQRWIEGRSIGVACMLTETGTSLLGATESLSSQHWPAPSEFIYRGSAGPIALTEQMQASIECLCDYMRDRFQVRGWLQFDFVEMPNDSLWLLECNPRWTAGMEVLVDAGINPVAEHLAAWGYSVAAPLTNPAPKLSAKAIVYATEELEVGQSSFAQASWDSVNVADIPYGPQRIEKGSPIATLKTWTDRQEPTSRDQQLQALYERLNEKRVELIALFK